MNMKKCLLLICILLFLTMIFCSCGDVIVEPKWIIGIKGSNAKVFSSLDYGKLQKVTITVNKKKQDGGVLEEIWKGVRIKDVFHYLGIKDYSSIVLTSSDDYSSEYTPDIIDDPLTIIGTDVNGKELGHENGYVQAVAGNQPESTWVKKLIKITVNAS